LRGIKFRAWDEDGFMFVPSCIMWDKDRDRIVVWNGATFATLGSAVIALMQYTGINDENGVEIYEGDIVTAGDNYPSIVEWNDTEAKFELFEKYPRTGKYADKYDRYHEMTSYTNGLGKVIGNIYESKQ